MAKPNRKEKEFNTKEAMLKRVVVVVRKKAAAVLAGVEVVMHGWRGGFEKFLRLFFLEARLVRRTRRLVCWTLLFLGWVLLQLFFV